MVSVPGRQYRVRRGVVPRARSHRRRDGAELRIHQRVVGDSDRRPGRLHYRIADQLLRREIRPRHGPADPWRRLWLSRLDGDITDLRLVHLYILCARSGHHGARARVVFRHAAGHRLSGQRAGCHPVGHARRHRAEPAATVDATTMAGAAAVALHRSGDQEPGCLSAVHHLFRARGRSPRIQPVDVWRSGDSRLLVDRANRRTGGLSAIPAREKPRQPGRVVERRDGLRARLDRTRHVEDVRRRISGVSRPST